MNRLRNEVSNARLIPVQDAQDYVKVAPVVHSDETSFKQANGDGKNPDRKKGWLWTVVSASVVVFEVALSRAKTVAMRLIGEDFRGIVVSDRYLETAGRDPIISSHISSINHENCLA